MLISVKVSLGRTGPMKRTCVGSVNPNSTTCPGPSVLQVGGAVPTVTVWPNDVTERSGVTCSANAIEAAATTSNIATATSARAMRRSGERFVGRVSTSDMVS